MNRDPHAFLMTQFECTEDTEEYLREMKPMLFKILLDGWYRDPGLWPEDRRSEVFDEWFEVSFHTGVVDLALERFKRKEY